MERNVSSISSVRGCCIPYGVKVRVRVIMKWYTQQVPQSRPLKPRAGSIVQSAKYKYRESPKCVGYYAITSPYSPTPKLNHACDEATSTKPVLPQVIRSGVRVRSMHCHPSFSLLLGVHQRLQYVVRAGLHLVGCGEPLIESGVGCPHGSQSVEIINRLLTSTWFPCCMSRLVSGG